MLKSKHSFDSKSSTWRVNIKFSVSRPNLEDKAILGQSSGGGSTSLQVAGYKLGGKAHGSLLPAEDVQVGL